MAETTRRLIQRAEKQLDSGRPTEALISLLQARHGHYYKRSADIEHLLGICHRLRGEFTEAEEAFDRALEYVGDVRDNEAFNRGRIVRDKAMLFLVQGRYDEAQERLETSRLLLGAGEQAPHSPEERIEYFVTVGFMGRLHAERGNLEAARECFTAADAELRGRAPYELNNLVWYMKAESFRTRCKLGRRALSLARQANNRRREVQILLLMASPKIARRLGG